MRKIRRNILKRMLGTNRICMSWHRLQVKRFGGIKNYMQMRKENKKRKSKLDINYAY